jgi:hypothetical protein
VLQRFSGLVFLSCGPLFLTGFARPTDYGVCIAASSTGTPPSASDCIHYCHPLSQTCASPLNPLTWEPASCDGDTPECIRELKPKPSWLTIRCECNVSITTCEATGSPYRVMDNPPQMVLDCH